MTVKIMIYFFQRRLGGWRKTTSYVIVYRIFSCWFVQSNNYPDAEETLNISVLSEGLLYFQKGKRLYRSRNPNKGGNSQNSRLLGSCESAEAQEGHSSLEVTEWEYGTHIGLQCLNFCKLQKFCLQYSMRLQYLTVGRPLVYSTSFYWNFADNRAKYTLSFPLINYQGQNELLGEVWKLCPLMHQGLLRPKNLCQTWTRA